MRTPDAEELLAGINRWVAIESKSGDLAGLDAMMDAAEAGFHAAGMQTQRIAGLVEILNQQSDAPPQ